MTTVTAFKNLEPQTSSNLNQATNVPARDLDEIYQYLTNEEIVEFERQKDYMQNGPGRIEAILNTEMDKLYQKMQSQIAK